MKGSDLHPKDHSIQLFTDASNEGWGAHLDHQEQHSVPHGKLVAYKATPQKTFK